MATEKIQVQDPIIIWSGAGTTNAPSPDVVCIGCNNDGISTANVYLYDIVNDTWRDTTQTVAGLFGV